MGYSTRVTNLLSQIKKGSSYYGFYVSKEQRALQEKAREFTEQVLFPYEMECEENNGISPETHKYINDQVMKWGFNATNHSKEHGGTGSPCLSRL